MKVTLSLTHRCNLACTYCYAGLATKPDMTLKTARRIVDFAVARTPADRVLDLGFFGGEPLLRTDLMGGTAHYAWERAEDAGLALRLGVTTNGTLLTQPVLDLVNKYDIGVCVSMDGPPEIHNAHRVYHDGRGSFDEVRAGLERALEQVARVQVNAVFGPEAVTALPETVAYLVDLGVNVIHLNPDICADWPPLISSDLATAYDQLADNYIAAYERGQELAINLIDGKLILFLKGGYAPDDVCGMGETEWGFAPSGNVYPCERFIGEDEDSPFLIGNVHTGLDATRRCAVLAHRGNRNDACTKCSLRDYCMNWCGCTNYYTTGHTDLAGAMLCASERAVIKAARRVFVTLSRSDNALFLDHLMRYAAEEYPRLQ